MDPINSNPFFNSARLYQNRPAQQTPPPSVDNANPAAETGRNTAVSGSESEFSTLFDDDALLKLQSNLEAIAQMAEQSLKKIDS